VSPVTAGGGEGQEEALAEILGELAGARAGESTEQGAGAARDIALLAVPAPVSEEPDVEASASLFRAAVAAGVGHLVVLGSALVHAPDHQHPGYVAEEALTRIRGGNPLPRAWRELEERARQAVAGPRGNRPGSGTGGDPGDDTAGTGGSFATRLTILRPVPVPVPGGRDFHGRLFSRAPVLTLPGYDPTLQILHPDDLVAAIVLALGAAGSDPPRPETYHVVPAGSISLRRAVRAAGLWRLPLPGWAQALPGSRRHWQLATLRHPWTVSGEKAARELGFIPSRSSLEALASRREDRPQRRRGRAPGPTPGGKSPGEESTSDDFGLDRAYVARLGKTLFRFLHDVYWRIEIRGLEHVPRDGAAVIAGVHRGFMPWDGVMAMYQLARETGRQIRFLLHPTLVKFPLLAPYMMKLGGVPASRENADRLLGRGELLGIFPEGIRGAFTPYRNAYRLGRFGRQDYVRMALAHQVPIVPFVTVGSAEIFPILARWRWRWWIRFSEWPCFPVTPTMGTVPLPSKWHTWYLPPVEIAGLYPPEAAADPAVVARIDGEVRRRMEAAFAELLGRRKHIFWGSLFTEGER